MCQAAKASLDDFGVRRSMFDVQRSMFNVRHPASAIPTTGFCRVARAR
jgi:hypothetical protein